MCQCYVFPVLLYGLEGGHWITKCQRLEAFAMWVYRRLLKIPWADHTTNKQVLDRISRELEVLFIIKKENWNSLDTSRAILNTKFCSLSYKGRSLNVETLAATEFRGCVTFVIGLISHLLICFARPSLDQPCRSANSERWQWF